MKILNITITAQDKLQITVDSAPTNLIRVYIDHVINYEYLYSDIIEDHTFSTRDFIVNDKVITVDLADWDINRSIFIVSLEQILDGVSTNTRKMFIDDEELYYGEVNMLISDCSNCLHKQQKERIVLLSVKQQLLQYALKHELLEDAIQLYMDITRLLGIDVKSSSFYKGILITDVDNKNVTDSKSEGLRYNKHSQYYTTNECSCTNGTCSIS